jgi:protein O-GlcNAc transferase
MEIKAIDELLARGALAEARAALEQLLSRQPGDRHALMRAIDVLTALRDLQPALLCAEQLLALDVADLDARFYLAKTVYASGDAKRAMALVNDLETTAASSSPVFQLLRGNVSVALGDLDRAEIAFAQSVMLDASFAEAYLNLGIVRRQRGKNIEAREALTRLTQIAPDLGEAWLQLAAVQSAQGDIDDAMANYQRALSLAPDRIDAWLSLATMQAETFQFAAARQSLDRLLQLAPQHEEARSLQGFVLAELGETEAARQALMPAKESSPLRILRHALLLPQVYRDADHLLACRRQYSEALEELADDPARWCKDPAQVFRFAHTNFLLAYQGGDDLALQTRYADLLHTLIGQTRPDLQAPVKKPTAHGRRIKVLFVSSFFRQCTIGHYFRSWVEQLDSKKFERVAIHTGWQLDTLATDMASRCDRVLLARGGALKVAEAIRAENADILIYPEVGMGTMNYLLANMRLAPIQCAAWGHPVTTGSREIDVFFSCAEMEPREAREHYRERLMLLPGIGTAYAAPVAAAPLARAAFGLENDRHLYVCPQSLFKVHPENDRIYLDLMAADERAVVVFFQAGAPAVTRDFADRIARQMVARGMPPRGQLKFLPRLDESGFRAVLGMADVVLDTLHWSGGNTSLDALSAGVPVVTMPGKFMRGRQTQAMLHQSGVPELIVADEPQMIARAIALASEPAGQQEIRRRLRAGRQQLFDRVEPVEKLAEHLAALFEAQ